MEKAKEEVKTWNLDLGQYLSTNYFFKEFASKFLNRHTRFAKKLIICGMARGGDLGFVARNE